MNPEQQKTSEIYAAKLSRASAVPPISPDILRQRLKVISMKCKVFKRYLQTTQGSLNSGNEGKRRYMLDTGSRRPTDKPSAALTKENTCHNRIHEMCCCDMSMCCDWKNSKWCLSNSLEVKSRTLDYRMFHDMLPRWRRISKVDVFGLWNFVDFPHDRTNSTTRTATVTCNWVQLQRSTHTASPKGQSLWSVRLDSINDVGDHH